ncbi:hypothetical protein M406DRAFT_100779 [Cryphonectria parasitica EP155]|uniref:Secreted protein n=1 Tax=Cryphonectria parasitica (strain ATCC 38755 / EP155) TaxID=660469 RepID=A0A9P4YBD5_CRYP1|nr:uncharacterized protein M406DRAFT_100779 [Cryphonectria parasitica EP155]KAF3770251.1 hypothetical protein M406DRAFT_100779 [Cryphonectria parasitica EP155]
MLCIFKVQATAINIHSISRHHHHHLIMTLLFPWRTALLLCLWCSRPSSSNNKSDLRTVRPSAESERTHKGLRMCDEEMKEKNNQILEKRQCACSPTPKEERCSPQISLAPASHPRSIVYLSLVCVSLSISRPVRDNHGNDISHTLSTLDHRGPSVFTTARSKE